MTEQPATWAEYRVRRPDGTSAWLQSDLRVVRTPVTGRVIEVHGSSRDVSARKAGETSERRAVERFEQSFVEAPVGMLLVADGQILRANRAIAALVGVETEALVGRRPREFVHADDRELVPPATAVNGQELRMVAPDGRTLRLRLQTSDLPAEGQRLTLVHALDVTDRHDAMRELDATRRLFETTFQHAPTGYLVAESAGDDPTVLRCNEAFARMVGAAPGDVVGRGARGFVHPDDALPGRRMFTDVRAGRPAATELRLCHRDGSAVWARVEPVALTGPTGEPLLLLQVQDITERKRFEGQLRHLADVDALTGLCSRSRFESELEREVSLVVAASAGRPACCCSTWTASRTSTTPSGTPSATSCSPASARPSAGSCAPATSSPGSAGTSSPWCCAGRTSRRGAAWRPCWSRRCARRVAWSATDATPKSPPRSG